MGEIKVKVKLENNGDLFLRELGKLGKQKIRAAEVEAWVDTGAVMMLLPQELVERLGLSLLGKAILTLANEQKVEMGRAGTLLLTVAGRKMPTDCLVGPPGCEVLIGQLVMESLDLIPDPLKRTLTPRPATGSGLDIGHLRALRMACSGVVSLLEFGR